MNRRLWFGFATMMLFGSGCAKDPRAHAPASPSTSSAAPLIETVTLPPRTDAQRKQRARRHLRPAKLTAPPSNNWDSMVWDQGNWG